MRYKKIIIKNYKAISKSIEIDFSKKSLFPIIGVNECGKTTILNAIFAFDYFNDIYDNSIHHLTDVRNLYSTDNNPAIIIAKIEVTKTEFKEIIEEYYEVKKILKKFRFPKAYTNDSFEFEITRQLDSDSKIYSIDNLELLNNIIDKNDFIETLIGELPYILYFDDFKDSFPDKIEINKKDKNQTWLSIIEQLFKETNSNFSIYDLSKLENRRRKSILGDVAKYLNKSLTKEWANFKLEEKEPLQIAIEYFTEDEEVNKGIISKSYLKFEVIDKDPDGNERFFYVRDRSKGFYWFFNFVMKLEFNPKINGSDNNAIYLLDEPGSYLHSFAQGRLCKKLKNLSDKHKVIYCTHSHYLLNPDVIPLNTISIANKSDYGEVELTPYYEFNVKNNKFPTSFQTIFDALHLQPLPYELTNKMTLLVEGIYDYYTISMFAPNNNINIIPCKGASTISQFISLMIGFKIKYKALWDNDDEGIREYEKATEFFGIEEAKLNFNLLPLEKKNKTRIIQDLLDSNDVVMIKDKLNLSRNISFEKMISYLYFSPIKQSIISLVSKETKSAFNRIYELLKI